MPLQFGRISLISEIQFLVFIIRLGVFFVWKRNAVLERNVPLATGIIAFLYSEIQMGSPKRPSTWSNAVGWARRMIV
jgi:hypothetical protein